MSIGNYEYQFTGEEDIEKIKLDLFNVNKVHLDLTNSNIEKEKYIEIINILMKKDILVFKLDLDDFKLDDDMISKLSLCLKNLNLYHFHLSSTNLSINDNLFEELFGSLKNMNRLEILHIVIQKLNLNEYKRKCLQRMIKECKNLKAIVINIRNNKSSISDVKKKSEEEEVRSQEMIMDDNFIF